MYLKGRPVDSTLSQKIVKRKTGDSEAKKLGEKKIEQYSNTVKIFTDGSKNARNQAIIFPLTFILLSL